MTYPTFGATKLDPRITQAQPEPEEGQFSRGLRSSTLGIGSQLNTLTGEVAQRLGATGFAADRAAAARDLSLRAAEAAPRVGSVRDVHSLRDAGDYLAGFVGSALPLMAGVGGATLLTRDPTKAALLAGGAMAPLEMGDVLQRQQAAGQPTNLRDAALYGGASAAAQALVPGLVRARMSGALTPASRAGHLAAIPENIALSAAGEGAKQVGAGQPLDMGQMAEAGLAGGLIAAPLAGLGALTHKGKPVSGKGSAGHQEAPGAPGAAPVGPGPHPGPENGPKGLKSPSEGTSDATYAGLSGLVDKVKGAGRAATDRVAQGLPVDFGDLASITDPATLRARAKELTEATIPKVKEWADKLATDVGLTDEQRAQLKKWADTLHEDGSRMGVAGMKKAREAASGLADVTEKLYGHVSDKVKGAADWKGLKDNVKPVSQHLYEAAKSAVDETADWKGLAKNAGPAAKQVAGMAKDAVDGVADWKGLAKNAMPAAKQVAGMAKDAVKAVPDKTIEAIRNSSLPPEVKERVERAIKDPKDAAGRAYVAAADFVARHYNGTDWAGMGRVIKQAAKAATNQVKGAAQFAGDEIAAADLKGKATKFAGDVKNAAKNAGAAVKDVYDRATAPRDEGHQIDDMNALADMLNEVSDGAKKSEQDTAMTGVIRDRVMTALKEAHPDTEVSTETINRLGWAISKSLENPHRLDAKAAEYLHHLLGPNYDEVLAQLSAASAVDGHDHALFKSLNEANQALGKRRGLLDTMRKHLRPEFQDEMTMPQLSEFADHLSAWATRTDRGNPKDVFQDQKVARMVEDLFDKPDAVFKLLEKENEPTKLQTNKAEGPKLAEERSEGSAKFDEGLEARDPEHGLKLVSPDLVERDSPNTKRLVNYHSGKVDKDTRVRWMSAKDYHDATGTKAPTFAPGEQGKHGYVVAESLKLDKGSDQFNAAKVREFTFDTKKGDRRTNQSALDIGPLNNGRLLDAVKLAAMGGDNPDAVQHDSPTSQRQRMASTFAHNLAGVVDHLWAERKKQVHADLAARKVEPGSDDYRRQFNAQMRRFRMHDIPDSTVLGIAGDEHGRKVPVTYGELKMYDPRTADDKLIDAQKERLGELRKQYAEAKKIGDRATMDRTMEQADKITRALWKDVMGDAPLLNEVRRDLTQYQLSDGRTKPDNTINIHEAERDTRRSGRINKYARLDAATRDEALSANVERDNPALVHKFNMDGTPVKLGDDSAIEIMSRQRDIEDGPHANRRQIGDRVDDRTGERMDDPEADERRWSEEDDAEQERAENEALMKRIESPPSDFSSPAAVTDFLKDSRELRDKLMNAERELTPQEKRVLQKLLDMFAKDADIDMWYTESGWEPSAKARQLLDGGTPDPKALAAKKAAFVEKARSGDADLIKSIAAETDPAKLQRAAEHLVGEKMTPEVQRVTDALNERIGALVRDDPDAAYNMQRTKRTAKVDPIERAEVEDHIDTVLGKSVKVEWARIFHAGEFARTTAGDVIRVSVHALNPLATAYHESLHAFFAKLDDTGNKSVKAVLMRAADAPSVRRQLERLLAGEPKALKQLANAEERAAYMYQFWKTGDLHIGPETKGVFTKLADFFRRVLGIWSNDERALHILEHFSSGEYAKIMRDGHAVNAEYIAKGTNRALEAAKRFVRPAVDLGETIMTAGGARLRDTGVPALRQLADAMKPTGRDDSKDPGFIAASRIERTKVLNNLAKKIEGLDERTLKEALHELQGGARAREAGAKAAVAAVREMLQSVRDYMVKAGVDVGDLGPDYFPRVYDADYVSRHRSEFMTLLQRHNVADPQKVVDKIIARDGSEFQVVRDVPGMQHLKERKLSQIPDDELRPYMNKNLYEILNGYVTQAVRRAEWAKRFGEDGRKLNQLLSDAKAQGATHEQVEYARKYTLGVDGTLGDNLNPTARRLMGDMIVYQNIRLLPLGLFSSLIDPVGIMVRGGTVADGWSAFKRGIKEMTANYGGAAPKDAATELAATLGVIDRASLVHALGASYTQGMVGDTGRAINNAFFRFNGMEQFNSSMRVAATEAAVRFIGRHADGKANQHSARWMAELGLTEADVHRDAQGNVKVTEADGLTPEQALKMRVAVNRWVDGAVLRPDATDKPVWMNDPHFMLVSHLKQFVYSFHETILKRLAHEVEHGNYNSLMAMSAYVPIMLAADMAKGLIIGGGSQPSWKDDWGPGDYLWSATQRAGLLGVGQFGVDAAEHIGSLTGPTIEQMTDAVKVLGGREQFSHFAIHSLPANALYSQAVTGHSAPDPTFAD